MNPTTYVDLAASAAAVLLFLFAARSFVMDSNHEPLGWGFGLASGMILAYLVKDELGGFGNGLRLGFGILLVLPALRALVDPKSTSIVTAVVGLLMAFGIAGNPVRHLIHSFGPATPQTELAETQTQLTNLELQKDRAQKILNDLVLNKEKLKREMRALNLKDEALIDHPKMEILATTIQAQSKWETALSVIEREIQAKQLRIQSIEAGLEIERMTDENPELEGIFDSIENGTADFGGLKTIEGLQYRKRAKEIIERELK